MIIDIHAHVLKKPTIIPWGCNSPFLSVNQQLEKMDSMGIDKAVILPLNDAEGVGEPQSMGEVLEICSLYPKRFIPFCNIDPRIFCTDNNTSAEKFYYLLNQYKQLGCKGVGELTARLPFTSKKILSLFEACEQLSLPILFHCTTENYPSYGVVDKLGYVGLKELLTAFPNLILIGHSSAFWSELHDGITNELEKNRYIVKENVSEGTEGALFDLMRSHSNLYADISAMSGFLSLTANSAIGYKFLKEFNKQIVFGLDHCLPEQNFQHLNWLKTLHHDGVLTNAEFENITCGNTTRLLNLNL